MPGIDSGCGSAVRIGRPRALRWQASARSAAETTPVDFAYAVLPCCVAVVLLIPLSAVVLGLGRLVRGTADAGTLLGAAIWTA
uniref:hypothetical protein n=1 Tax=Nocardia brasiliensis TaxID=37326 RepID=UPI0024567889